MTTASITPDQMLAAHPLAKRGHDSTPAKHAPANTGPRP